MRRICREHTCRISLRPSSAMDGVNAGFAGAKTCRPSPFGQRVALCKSAVLPICEPRSLEVQRDLLTISNKKGPSFRMGPFYLIWSEWPDLNRRPPHPQCGALPGCATLRFLRLNSCFIRNLTSAEYYTFGRILQAVIGVLIR